MDSRVEMFRDAAEVNGRDRFACALPVWEFLWELGQTFGWRPQGTTYLRPTQRKIEAPVRHNYQPGDTLDHKQVEAEDALQWAGALDRARQSPHFAGMLKACGDTPSESLPGIIGEFIQFAYGGAFVFAISAANVDRS